jgi:hypothetical protein
VNPEFNPLVSITANATAQPSRTIPAKEIPHWLRTGSHRPLVAKIRKNFAKVLADTGDAKAAKKAVDADKKNLPGIMPSGDFTARGDKNLKTYSQFLCGDVDGLAADQVGVVYDQVAADPHCIFPSVSPSGFGVKFFCRTTGDASQHERSVAAMAKHFLDTYGIELDPACKNLERLCFAPDNASEWNGDAVPFDPLPLELKAERVKSQSATVAGSTREQIAEKLLGEIQDGFCKCPGEHLHTSANGAKDCKVMLDGVATIKCFHASCSGIVAGVNHELRSQIGKAERPTAPTGVAAEYLGDDVEQPKTGLLERLEARIYSAQVKPIEPMPRFFLAGVQVSTAGNLTTISAQAKAGKSAAIGAMIGSTFAASDADCLGFTSENPNGFAVVHLDTEQAPFDHWEGNQRTNRRAKVDTAPAWLRSYCLTGFSAADVRLAIRILTAQSAKQFGGVHSVFVDGIADAVHDVNDPAETSSLITELHKLAIEFDCPVLNIVHLNPGSDFKTRGHLGSQLERKSETNLRLEKDDCGATVIWADKNRRAPIPKNTAPRFAWNDEAGMHVTVASQRSSKDDAEKQAMQIEAEAVFSAAKNAVISYGQFITFLEREVHASKSTAKRRFGQMLRTQIIRKELTGFYTLNT